MGMLDIVAGLEWVHDNIEVFGGDPGNVMIFGESGGGAKTSCLYAMPAAAPELSRNKPLMVGWNEDEYTFFGLARGEKEAFKLDFVALKKRLEEEYSEDAQQILETYRKIHPEASASDIYVAIRSITMMGLGSLEIAEKKAAQEAAPVYLYNFGYKSEVKIPGTDYPLGTPHAMDIQFKFYNVQPKSAQTEEESPGMGGNRPERFAASRNFSEMWTSFARTGIPSAKGQPYWPPFNLESRPMMRIDSNCEVIHDRFHRERELWDGVFQSS